MAPNYPTKTPAPGVDYFEERPGTRCPVEVPEHEWKQRIAERLGYADWGALMHGAATYPKGWGAVTNVLSAVQDDLYMEMQERRKEE